MEIIPSQNIENHVDVSSPAAQAENLIEMLARLDPVHKGDEEELSKRVATANKIYVAIQHAAMIVEDIKVREDVITRAKGIMEKVMSNGKPSPDDRYIVTPSQEEN